LKVFMKLPGGVFNLKPMNLDTVDGRNPAPVNRQFIP